MDGEFSSEESSSRNALKSADEQAHELLKNLLAVDRGPHRLGQEFIRGSYNWINQEAIAKGWQRDADSIVSNLAFIGGCIGMHRAKSIPAHGGITGSLLIQRQRRGELYDELMRRCEFFYEYKLQETFSPALSWRASPHSPSTWSELHHRAEGALQQLDSGEQEGGGVFP